MRAAAARARLVLLPLALGLLAACSGGSDSPTAIELPVTRIEADDNCGFLLVGETCTIQVRAFNGEQRISNPVLRWQSENSAIVEVDSGTVTGRVPGQAFIRVSNTTDTVSKDVLVHVLVTQDEPK